MKCIPFCFVMLFFVFTFSSFAQEGNCDTDIPSKAIKKFEKYKKNFTKSHKESREGIIALIEEYPNYVAPVYFLAEHYKESTFRTTSPELKEKLIAKTIAYYQQSIDICPEFSGHLAYYYLGIFYHKYENDLKSAAENFQSYLVKEKEHPKRYKKRAQDLADEYFTKFRLLENPVPFNPQKLKGVCTDEDEYLPMLSPDNNYLYLTRKRVTPLDLTQPLKNGNDNNEYFIKSRKMSVDSFSNGRILGAPFNQFTETYGGLKLVGQGGVTLTPDNKQMYLTLTLLVPASGQGYKNTQIYHTEMVDGEWKPLKPVGRSINDENNLPTWEGQACISSDGKTMVFATARPSSTSFMKGSEEYNSMDLYVVQKMTNGQWGVPKSIGESINTPGNEKTPFLHNDGKTLYFSSNGHPGMGGYDIFYSQVTDDGEWSKPINIGYPINTENDEHGLMVSIDGKYAYMSSGEQGGANGALDIVHFPLYPEARPEKVMFIKGKLEGDQGQQVKNGKITIKDEVTGEIHEAIVDKATGEYVAVVAVKDPEKKKIEPETTILELRGEEYEVPYGSKIAKVNGVEEIIPPGAQIVELEKKEVVLKKGEVIRKVNDVKVIVPKDHEIIVKDNKQLVVAKTAIEEQKKEQSFVVTATGDNMAFSTESIKVDPEKIDGVQKVSGKKVQIQESKKGETIRLNEVNFTTNSYLLNSKTMLVLDELLAFLNTKPTMQIAIHGHTDNVGDEKENKLLSENRAKEVVEFLMDNGIAKGRLKFEGFGSSKPKVKNDSELNRSINRRVEFVILQL